MTTDSIGEYDMGEPGVVEPRTAVEPQTAAGRALRDAEQTIPTAIHPHPTYVTACWLCRDIRAIEDEARAAALDAVEEAVKGLHRDGRSDVNFRAVLAAIANLRSDGETRSEPTLTTDTVTERERTAYWRGFHKKAIDGSHIPGSKAER